MEVLVAKNVTNAASLLLADANPVSGGPLELFGVKLVGMTPENGKKLLITLGFVLAASVLAWLVRRIVGLAIRSHRTINAVFWARQATGMLLAIALFIGVLSIWFDSPSRLTTFMGLVGAGAAFALQQPISALAGYLVILRGNTYGVGDRISIGGVRGDVIALGFIHTTIMEMGEPAGAPESNSSSWLHDRQYTGRIVTLSNARVFSEAVNNYTREFPFLWEELRLPAAYSRDRDRAERILLEVADRHTVHLRDLSADALAELERRYFTRDTELAPRVYCRLTDQGIAIAVRFIAPAHGVRALKDVMTRDILKSFEKSRVDDDPVDPATSVAAPERTRIAS